MRNALRIMTADANRALSDRSSTVSDRETAVTALLAIDWNPDLAREVGHRPICRLLRLLRSEGLGADDYRFLADTIAHAAGESNPIGRPNWLLWKALVIRYHLFEAADTTQWISLIAKLDTRGIRTPPCLAGFAFSDICSMGWETREPDISAWLWQAARQDAAPLPLGRPRLGSEGATDFQDLIYSLRTDSVDSTAIGREFCELRDEFGLPAHFEFLSNAGKCAVISDAGWESATIARRLRLAAKRNTVRAFGGSIRAAAPGMQPYANFCVFAGRPALPVQTESILLWSGLFYGRGAPSRNISRMSRRPPPFSDTRRTG